MSQFYVIPNGGAPAVPTSFSTNLGTATPAANILNVVGLGIASSGTSAAGNIFITGSGNTVTVNETQAQFLTGYRQTAISSPVGPTDFLIGCTAGGITITLPAVPATNRIIVIKDESGTAMATPITVAGNGQNIDGLASITLNQNYASENLYYNGSSWYSY